MPVTPVSHEDMFVLCAYESTTADTDIVRLIFCWNKYMFSEFCFNICRDTMSEYIEHIHHIPRPREFWHKMPPKFIQYLSLSK